MLYSFTIHAVGIYACVVTFKRTHNTKNDYTGHGFSQDTIRPPSAVENSFHHGTLWRPPPAPVTHPSTFKHFPPGISFILYPFPNLRRHINCMIALFFYTSISAQPSSLEDPPCILQAHPRGWWCNRWLCCLPALLRSLYTTARPLAHTHYFLWSGGLSIFFQALKNLSSHSSPTVVAPVLSLDHIHKALPNPSVKRSMPSAPQGPNPGPNPFLLFVCGLESLGTVLGHINFVITHSGPEGDNDQEMPSRGSDLKRTHTN